MLMFGYAWLELVALVCSRVSIFGWIGAGVYQLYLGTQNKENIGFSPLFLAGYVIGDICNVFGCFWGDQMRFQKIIVLVMLTTDSLMALQFWYYTHAAARRSRSGRVGSPSTALVTAAMFGISHAFEIQGSRVAPAPPQMDYKFLVGQIMAWCAQTFYVSGVIPQVYSNFKNKCTGGVSQFLFMADLIGSIGYIATLLATAQSLDDQKESVQFLFDELAYLLGTTTCLVLDLILMVQYVVYPEFASVEVLDGLVAEATERVQEVAKESSRYGAVSSK